MFAFATDLVDEGMDTVLDNVAVRAGVGGITLAAAYHHGRDIFPHNPRRKVHFLEGGTVFFRPQERRYGALKPILSKVARESDVLSDLCAAAAARSMPVRAWTVFLHNYALGEARPECACENAFGDRHLTDLCPANPEVREYVRALTADIAAHGASSVVAESLHYHGLEHGFHHERYFIDLGALGRYLLGLCFCEHCLRAAAEAGVDGRRLKEQARQELESRFQSPAPHDQPELSRDEVAAFAGGELGAYLEARCRTVTSLASEAAQSARAEGADLAFIDLSGAVKGYATGKPQGEAAPAIGWQFGIDTSQLAACCGVEAIGYAADPQRLRFDLDAYRGLMGASGELSVILRPMAPDCESSQNLAAKLDVARANGASSAGFYHYGFMRLDALDLIADALQRGGAARQRPPA